MSLCYNKIMEQNTNKIYDVAIIGGGPAGLAAGLYAARAGRSALLIEEMTAGGQITKTHNVENYPGFDEGIDGFSLAAKMEQQAARFGLETKYATVQELSLSRPVKRIGCGKKEFFARTVILAMGAEPRLLGVPGEVEQMGTGVSYCATCDGAFFRGMPVAVVGGGDTAISDALYLAHFAERVYVVHRREALRAAHVLQDAAKQEKRIEFVLDSLPEEILGGDAVEGLRVKNKKTGEAHTLAVKGVFVAVGTTPRSALVREQLPCDANGYIVTDAHMRTAIPGVYAAGDVRVTPLRQVITAAADGAVAATAAVEYLMEQGGNFE